MSLFDVLNYLFNCASSIGENRTLNFEFEKFIKNIVLKVDPK